MENITLIESFSEFKDDKLKPSDEVRVSVVISLDHPCYSYHD